MASLAWFGIRIDDPRLLECSVGRKSAAVDGERGARLEQIVHVEDVVGSAEQIVVQQGAPAGLGAKFWSAAAEIERLAATFGVVHRNANGLARLVVGVFEARDIVEHDDIFGEAPLADVEADVFELVAGRADALAVEQHETADHIGRRAIDDDFELKILLISGRAA